MVFDVLFYLRHKHTGMMFRIENKILKVPNCLYISFYTIFSVSRLVGERPKRFIIFYDETIVNNIIVLGTPVCRTHKYYRITMAQSGSGEHMFF